MARSLPPLNSLRAFEAAARHLSFTKAAEELNVSVRTVQRRMKHMVWGSGCNSWYLSEDGSNHSLYRGFAAEYAHRARNFDARDYELVR